jgi:protein O-GlcNAc transferase
MDYYLTSDLMEPDNAEEHYSEKLIRLPNLSLTYRKPELRSKVKTRDQFGIRQNAFVYLMSQSFYKCLPQYDSIYARIARNVPDAQFVMISRHGSEITDQFMRRLAKAFSRYDLNHRDFCLVAPKLNFQDFLSLNHCSDVLLDTFCWSGGKTTLEAVSCGLPVVTCPGPYMRARHSFGILKMIDLDETIARDETHYVQIASRLGTDTAFYQSVCRKLKRNRNKLYEDQAPVRALETFYRSVVRRTGSKN